ncbi:MAG: TRAM domain-containing protein [bacterium]
MRIERIATGGDGVGRSADGRVVFVPFAAPGETVRASCVEEAPRFLRARLEAVLAPSAERVEPRCALFGICGGCSLMHLSPPAQLAVKDGIVADHLVRPGLVEASRVAPTRPSPEHWHFRHRMRFHARRGKLGLFRPKSQSLVEIARCPVSAPRIDALLAPLAVRVAEVPTTALEIEIVDDGAACALAVSAVAPAVVDLEALARRFQAVPGVTSVVARAGARRFVVGDAIAHDAAPPGSFRQANPLANEWLRTRVADAVDAAGPGADEVLELYAGGGNFTSAIAARGHRVLAVEQDPHAVAAGERAANGRPAGAAPIRFVRASVEPFLRGRAPRAACVVLNPPRIGLPAKTAPAIARLGARGLIYVSCNPATLGRDLARLRDEGFEVQSVEPIDLFPHTAHVECVAILRR